MNSEAFVSLYLKEIGVQTPISSFLADCKEQPLDSPVEAPKPSVSSSVSAVDTKNNSEMKKPVMVEVAEPMLKPVAAGEVANKRNEAHSLNDLQQQCVVCTACSLSESRNQVVFGSGNSSAPLVFIGDAPDRDEDEQGMPAVGRSGALFERMIAAIGMDKEQVYWLHSVKCRPLHSRDPKPDEFQACQSWLLAQLDFIQPRLICVLGRVAAQALLQTDACLSELRANQHTFRGTPVLVLDHPAYLLRSQQHKARAWKDLLRLQTLVAAA